MSGYKATLAVQAQGVVTAVPDLFEADGASGRPVRSYVVPGIRELAAEDDPSLRPGRRGELLGDRLRFPASSNGPIQPSLKRIFHCAM